MKVNGGLSRVGSILVCVGVFLVVSGQSTFSQQGLQITSQPKSLTVAIGSPAILAVAVSNPSGDTPSYQWQRNSINLPGMTNSQLTLGSVQLCDNGLYSVTVSNSTGSVVSDPAILLVVGVATWGYAQEETSYIPTGVTDAVALGAAMTYSLLLKQDGTLWATGANDQGELNIPAGLNSVTAISAGAHHSLALTAAGTVVQWGSQLTGQGTVPPGLSNVIAISAGAFHSLALKSDHTVVAWGSTSFGRVTVPKNLTGVVAISAGYSHDLALRGDGTIVAWGDNTYNQLNVPADASNVVAIAAGDYHNLALKADGTVAAWGANDDQQTNVPAGLSRVIAVAAGGFQSLALKSDGTLVGWGLIADPYRSQRPACLDGVVAIAAVSEHNQALVGSGPPFLETPPFAHAATLGTFTFFRVQATGMAPLSYQWRFNGSDLPGETNGTLFLDGVRSDQAGLYSVVVSNRLGQVTSSDTELEVPQLGIGTQPQDQIAYPTGNAVLSVGATGTAPFSYQWKFAGVDLPGATDSILTLTNLGWGQDGLYTAAVSNAAGSITSFAAHLTVRSIATWGYQYDGKNNVPAGLTNVVAIAEGETHMVALLADGTVRAWGSDFFGQIDVPPGLSHVVAIAAGDVHSVALKDDGTVVTWGDRLLGRIVPPSGLSNVTAIAACWPNVVALRTDGTVVAWGSSFEGISDVPPGLQNVVAIQTSEGYSMALRADGTVVGWGSAWPGVPQGLSNVVAIAAGYYSCLAVKRDGTVVTWGPDPSGIQARMPAGLSNVVSVAAGDNHFLVARQDGSLVAWGVAYDGRTNIPPGLPAVSLPAAGPAHCSALVGYGPPFLVSLPVSCAGGRGTDLFLRSLATGSWPLSYQWRLNGADLPGATNNVLWLSGLQDTQAGAYSVVVSNTYGSVTSAEATVTVQGVAITLQPVPQVTYQGGNASFTVQATGQGNISYQWLFNGVAIPGATNAVLTLANVQPAQAGAYLAQVSNLFGSVTSSEATLTVLPALITAQPVTREVLEGGAVTFEVAVQGIPPFTYQWQFNGVDLPGMTNSTLSLANILPGQAGAYSVVVTSAFGSISSSPAICYVLTIAAWGGNSYGQITIPIGLTNVIAIAGGGDYTLALKADGTVAAWGDFRFGQTNPPVGLNHVTAIARGALHNLALRSDGTIVAWGDNTYGQTNTPSDITNATAISAGDYHNLALLAGGFVTAWGDDRKGQTSVPSGLNNVVAIAGVASYSLALRADGTVVAWGDNTYGQTNVPPGLTNVIAISGEATHALALKADGTVVSWGGVGGNAVPLDLTNVVAIAGGQAHDVALLADGSVTAWGDNTYGQAQIPQGLTNVMAVAAGRDHTVALLSDGSPKVTVQPWDQQAPAGANLVLVAKGVGEQPLDYQWQFNGVDITGATQAAYSITNVQAQNAGNYDLVISNPLGKISTRRNKLSLLTAPSAPPQFVAGSARRASDGGFQAQIQSAPGSQLWIETSTDLLHWTPLNTATNDAGIFTLVIPAPVAGTHFYRAISR